MKISNFMTKTNPLISGYRFIELDSFKGYCSNSSFSSSLYICIYYQIYGKDIQDC